MAPFKRILIACASFFAFWGPNALAGNKGLHLSLTGMALTSAAQQGGDGPKGTSVLTHTDLVYNIKYVGLGLFLQYDLQGSAQKDFGYGPKLEIHFGPFYSEFGYTAQVKRTYTDRAIAQDTGTGWMVGLGVRFMAGGGGRAATSQGGVSQEGEVRRSSAGVRGWFFQACYRYRSQHITRQDGLPIGETITQKDGYPTFGFGYLF